MDNNIYLKNIIMHYRYIKDVIKYVIKDFIKYDIKDVITNYKDVVKYIIKNNIKDIVSDYTIDIIKDDDKDVI